MKMNLSAVYSTAFYNSYATFSVYGNDIYIGYNANYMVQIVAVDYLSLMPLSYIYL